MSIIGYLIWLSSSMPCSAKPKTNSLKLSAIISKSSTDVTYTSCGKTTILSVSFKIQTKLPSPKPPIGKTVLFDMLLSSSSL